ncbi:DUF2357 domain-containing protein [uncultured Lamprocystis sp.]|uniref:DUF2357 domain-containing protein n=1 Tax=uncultured Lamprocystis sp. TaxID=543132 RepID=UPI0025DC7C64|nr:DUF2357 domain-containing protein [uncultured Lamprocystis sp.]
MPTPIIALRYPWSLYAGARMLPRDDALALAASDTLALVLPTDCLLQAVRHPHQPCASGEPFRWERQRWQRWLLPAAAMRGDENLELRLFAPDGSSDMRYLRLVDNLGCYNKKHPLDATNRRALDREMLIGMIVELIVGLLDVDPAEQAAQGRMRGWVRADWRQVAVALAAERDVAEPRMALIVRHARDLRRLVEELGQHPRRVLTRNRRLQAVHRIQEMDSACLAWYVRQPGRTPIEKAGSRQALLAVVREETVDTPENRVLKDFIHRSVQATEIYLTANRNLSDSTRYGEVSRYGRGCAALLHLPAFATVHGLAGPAKPNFVLTSDQRYRRIWDAYQALLRRQDDVDEAWTWQGRLWADLVTMAVLTALLDAAEETLALAPLYLHREQDRGRWLAVHSCAGVFATPDRVLMVYAADTAPADLISRYAPLAPTLIVTRARIGGGRARDILVWSVTDTGVEPFTLDRLVLDAAQALVSWHRNPAHHAVQALLLMAPACEDSPLITAQHGDVVGLALPVAGSDFGAGLARIAAVLTGE